MTNYYQSQLNRINTNDQINIKFWDDSAETNTLTLNKHSIDNVIEFLNELKKGL